MPEGEQHKQLENRLRAGDFWGDPDDLVFLLKKRAFITPCRHFTAGLGVSPPVSAAPTQGPMT
jgi:hypothetical protein